MILKKNRNQSYLSTYKKHNLVSYHESEKTIINSSNWLEELTFIGQNITANDLKREFFALYNKY